MVGRCTRSTPCTATYDSCFTCKWRLETSPYKECPHPTLCEHDLCGDCPITEKRKMNGLPLYWDSPEESILKAGNEAIAILTANFPEVQEKEEGVKYDQDKLRYDLIPSYPLEQLVKVYTFGAKKYADENWRKGISWKRIFAAMMRHSWAWMKGEELDEETGINHLAHAAWGCFALIEYSKTRREFDDRILPLVEKEKE